MKRSGLLLGLACLAASTPARGAPAVEAPRAPGVQAPSAPAAEAPDAPAAQETRTPALVEAAPAEATPEPASPSYAAPRIDPPVPPAVNLPPLRAPASEDPCGARSLCLSRGEVAVWPRVGLRFGYEAIQPDEEVLFLGQNDGFRLDQMRVGLEARFAGELSSRVRIDAARILAVEQNDPVASFTAGVVDAFLSWTPHPSLALTLGRTRMPTDREGGAERTALVWATRSVAAGGVAPGRGFAVDGLSPGRDLGLVFSAKSPRLGPLALAYDAAVANGDGGVHTRDDDALASGFARASLSIEDAAGLGAGGRFSPRRIGVLPALHEEREVGGFVEGWARLWGFEAAAVVQGARRTFGTVFPDPADPSAGATGLGATAWILADAPFGLDLFGASIGLRASVLEPVVAVPDLHFAEASLGARWDAPFLQAPVSLLVDVTTLVELDPQWTPLRARTRAFALAQLDL